MNPDGIIQVRDPLRRLLARVPQSDHPTVGQAYHIAFASHEGQHRDTGQPFIIHPIAVALLLASEMGFSRDTEMMTAALLHDAVEDSALDIEDIAPTFGRAVATLVRGVTKAEASHARNRSTRRAATLQKLFAAAREDPRVLILKLADRVHNMRSIGGIEDPSRRARIARETVELYAPISHLLGMGRTTRELQNASFGCLEPDAVVGISSELDLGPPASFCNFADAVTDRLRQQDIRSRTRLQAKSLRSIHNKMIAAQAPMSNVYDRYAVEVLVSSRDACYRSLGTIHGHFAPVMESVKDFIALPKRNRYQALHTTVLHAGHRFEVHIQTPAMHRMGELGVAVLKGDRIQEASRRRWLEELSDWHDHDVPSHHLLDELHRILFIKEIVTFTPEGDAIVLPDGATVLDFAFAVHTDLGTRCHAASVNGKPSSPFAVLSWGDTVEIETNDNKRPRQHWLRHIKSYRARRFVKHYLHKTEGKVDGDKKDPVGK